MSKKETAVCKKCGEMFRYVGDKTTTHCPSCFEENLRKQTWKDGSKLNDEFIHRIMENAYEKE